MPRDRLAATWPHINCATSDPPARHLGQDNDVKLKRPAIRKRVPTGPASKRTRGFAHETPVPASDEWYTPPKVTDPLGPFGTDPCSPGADIVPWISAERHYTKQEDGLKQPWIGRCWVNPPYSAVAPWLEKLAAHRNGFALVFARTDTKWWHEWVAPHADAVCFIKGRLRFIRPDGTGAGTAAAPSALIAYGPDCVTALERSGLGFVTYPGREQRRCAYPPAPHGEQEAATNPVSPRLVEAPRLTPVTCRQGARVAPGASRPAL